MRRCSTSWRFVRALWTYTVHGPLLLGLCRGHISGDRGAASSRLLSRLLQGFIAITASIMLRLELKLALSRVFQKHHRHLLRLRRVPN